MHHEMPRSGDRQCVWVHRRRRRDCSIGVRDYVAGVPCRISFRCPSCCHSCRPLTEPR